MKTNTSTDFKFELSNLKSAILRLAACSQILAWSSAWAAVRYVNANSPAPAPPYATWATAAVTIQDAVDVAAAGDEIVVTNGVYAAGGRAVYGTMTNRVAVDRPLFVHSVNGPQFTLIQGRQVPGTTNGDVAIRCAYLTNGAVLSGFTLTNGATRNNGDDVKEQAGGGVWCESAAAVVSNCVLVGCSARWYGGGAWNGALMTSTLIGNFASEGGGVMGLDLSFCTASNCTLIGNSASDRGGAAQECMLFRCSLIGNRAVGSTGGGAEFCTLNNCVLITNYAHLYGGGADGSMLNNCALLGNSTVDYGGGAAYTTLNNCTLVGNWATNSSLDATGGGAYVCTLNNCIAYFNTANKGANYDTNSTLNYCCTTPQPAAGNENITLDPLLLDVVGANLRLQSNSPCINAGNNDYAPGATELDGNPRIFNGTVDIGAYEFQGSSSPIPPYLTLQPSNQTVTAGATVTYAAAAGGTLPLRYQWSFNGTALSGATNSLLSFTNVQAGQSGDYFVTVTNGAGSAVSSHASLIVNPSIIHYVNRNNASPVPPFTSWATAATSIQAAIESSVAWDQIVVTNGLYASGSKVVGGEANRVAVDKPLALRSVNGPNVTVISGESGIRCAYLADGANLAGFTLTNGLLYSGAGGGGALCETTNATISNCILAGNYAYFGGGANGGTLNNCLLSTNRSGRGGGGSAGSVLNHCMLTGNQADAGGGAASAWLNNCLLIGNAAGLAGRPVTPIWSGGGAYQSILNNCTLVSNQAGYYGGGAQDCSLINCIIYFNSAPSGSNYYYFSAPNPTMSYCCTAPDPGGVGNTTLDPLFVDLPAGNLHLQSNSPCINAGINFTVLTSTDLDGNPRIIGGTVDMGAYEFQGSSGLTGFHAWLALYGLPTDGSADYIDSDRDGRNNWQEWRCGTNPTNALSVLRLISAAPSVNGVSVTWQSTLGIGYFLERSTNLNFGFITVVTNLPGQAGTTSYLDAGATEGKALFYRVGVAN